MEYQDTLPGIDWLTREAELRTMGQQALFSIEIEGDD